MTLTKTQAAQRLRRLEVEILPPPPVPTAILHQPDPDAPEAERQAFERDLAAARRAQAKVWVVTGEFVGHMGADSDVTYCTHLWEAQLGVLPHLPSSEGRPSALHDLAAMLKGTAKVIRPDPEAALPDLGGDDDGEPLVLSARIYEAQPQNRVERSCRLD